MGFLNYMVKCILLGKTYNIYGYKGKQVRDNMHAHDLVTAFDNFYKNPVSGEAYNMGGSRFSHSSLLELIEMLEVATGEKLNTNYINDNRRGDHVWYVSDVRKFQKHYPDWKYKYDLNSIIDEVLGEH